MKRAFILPGVTILAGAAGFFLRRQELAGAVDLPGGLGTPGTVSLLLIALSVLLLCVLVAGSLRLSCVEGYARAFGAPHALYLPVFLVPAGLTAAAGVLSLQEFFVFLSASGVAGLSQPGNPLVSRGVLGVVALGGAAAFLLLGLRLSGRMKQKGKYSLAALMPSFLCCVWLFGVYQSRAADPILLRYLYVLLAVMLCALSGYFMAGFLYEKPKPRLVAVGGLMAVYLCAVSQAEAISLIDRMLFTGMGVYLLASVTVFLHRNRAVGTRLKTAGASSEIPTETEEPPHEP